MVDEQSKQRKSDNSQLPQVNGPEMQLYEIQSEFTNVHTNLGSVKVFIIMVITDFDPVITVIVIMVIKLGGDKHCCEFGT